MSASRSFVHARVEKHIRRANTGGKFRLGGTSVVYEDPHGLSLRWLRLRDVLNEDTDSTGPAHGHGKVAKQEKHPAQARQALIAVGGRGPWDEPLVAGEIYNPMTDKWSDTLVAYHLDAGSWSVVQTSRPPPRLRDYTPALVCCASMFMLCVSWCDPANRRDKVVWKVFEMNLGLTPLLQWTEASAHPDAPMDSNSVRHRPGQDQLVEMFRIFGKILDFATACRVSGSEQSWSCIARENAAAMADAMSCRLKSLAVLLL
ncbi:hypothetical protein VPH35_014326 [Triticum aestivum]